MWEFSTDRPIYLQLMERLQLRIVNGTYPPGDQFPSVRELAQEASVNPNTVQKALSELERSGILYTQRTNGRFITEDEELLKELKKERAGRYLAEFVENMHNLGLKDDEILTLLNEKLKEERKA